MKRQFRVVGFVAGALLVAPTACKQDERASAIDSNVMAAQSDSATAASASASAESRDATRLDYESMKRMYLQMASKYARMGNGETNAKWMDQMASQMGRLLHSSGGMAGHPAGMMGRRGMMGHSGMMGGRMMGGRMMGHSGMMGAADCMDRWNAGMARLNEQWAEQARRNGHDELARMHDELAGKHIQAAQKLEQEGTHSKPAAPKAQTGNLDGAALFGSNCAGCHGSAGQGVAQAFPPLRGEPVTGSPERVVEIVRGGTSGPLEVHGAEYNGVMPAFGGRLSDAEIAAVLSYVRGAWGNDAGPIAAAQVSTGS